MRSIYKERGKSSAQTKAINFAEVDTRLGKRTNTNVCYSVIGWPMDKTIPNYIADWLAFLLRYRVLEEAQQFLEDGDILMVRYNLVAFQLERADFLPLFPMYPQVIVLQKIGDERSKNYNVWVDGVMSSMIRNGNAYGKRIYAKQYVRSLYNISRMLSSLDDDMIDSLRIFPHAPHHFYWNSNVAYPILTDYQPFQSAPQ